MQNKYRGETGDDMLIVALDASRKEPLYEQIYNSIKEEIVTGALPFRGKASFCKKTCQTSGCQPEYCGHCLCTACVQKDILSQSPKRGFLCLSG